MRARTLPALLLVLPLVALVAPAQDGSSEGGDWVVADDQGDLRPLIDVGASYPATPLGAHVDVTELAIRGEDELGFVLDIKVAQLNVAAAQSLCCLASGSFFAEFKVSSSPIVYRLNLFLQGSETNANTASTFSAFFVDGQLCLADPERGGCYYQPIFPTLDDEADTIHVYIPKASLLGVLQPPGFFFNEIRPAGAPANVRPGDQLMDLVLTTSYTPGLLVIAANMQDDVPNEGTASPYRFQRGTANSVIQVGVGSGDGSHAVQAGANQSIPFSIQNKAAGKRLVQLAYEVVGADDAKKLFKVYGPSSVTVPGGQSRNFSLAVDVGAASQDQGVILKVRGTSVGHDDEVGLGTVRLIPSTTLSETSNTLFMHVGEFPFFEPALEPVYCANQLLFGSCTYGFLSPMEKHPLATEGGRYGSGGLAFGDGPQEAFFLETDLATAAPIMFDTAKPITMDIELATSTPVTAQVFATLVYSSEDASDVLFEAQTSAPLSATSSVVTLTGPPRFNPDVRPVLAAGTWMLLRVEVTYDLASPGTVEWAAGGAQMVSEGTKIVLPLVELPEDLRREVVASPLQISAVDEPEDFVNPGEGRLYNVSVLNQAESPIRFTLEATSSPTWGQLLLPGDRFEVPAGDTVTFGVLVTADGNASEGDLGTTWVNATALDFGGPDQNVSTVGLVLRTIVTQFDLPDDSAAYVADPDDSSKLLAEEAENTPGFHLLALVAAGVLAAAVHSRRRSRK